MNKYEVLYILEAELSDEAKGALVDKFAGVVTGMGGEVTTIDKWGDREYAYPIDYKTTGYYTLMNFSADSNVPAELERQMRITDGVVRFMVTRKDK